MQWNRLVIALVSGAACGTSPYDGGPRACTPSATKICMAGTLFDPSTLPVISGTTVSWQNADATPHTATSNPANPTGCPSWNIAVAGGATSLGVALIASSRPVTCEYYCKFHATPTTGPMRASITIQ